MLKSHWEQRKQPRGEYFWSEGQRKRALGWSHQTHVFLILIRCLLRLEPNFAYEICFNGLINSWKQTADPLSLLKEEKTVRPSNLNCFLCLSLISSQERRDAMNSWHVPQAGICVTEVDVLGSGAASPVCTPVLVLLRGVKYPHMFLHTAFINGFAF